MQRLRGSDLLGRLLEKHQHHMTPRLKGILTGTMRREVSKTREQRSAWGRKMLARRGGLARMVRCDDPRRLRLLATAARRRSAALRREKKELAELGLEKQRIFYGNLDGI